MNTKLTEAYVENHMQYIDASAKKIGEKVAQLVLKSTMEHIKKNGPSDSIKLDGTFEVKAFQDVCIEVQVCLPFVGCSTIHVGI